MNTNQQQAAINVRIAKAAAQVSADAMAAAVKAKSEDLRNQAEDKYARIKEKVFGQVDTTAGKIKTGTAGALNRGAEILSDLADKTAQAAKSINEQ